MFVDLGGLEMSLFLRPDTFSNKALVTGLLNEGYAVSATADPDAVIVQLKKIVRASEPVVVDFDRLRVIADGVLEQS
jgi:hypothetical protein